MPILTEQPFKASPSKEPPPGGSPIKPLALLASLVLALGVGIGQGLADKASFRDQPQDTRVTTVTRVDYERLDIGMTQFEVESILDPGVEVSRSEGQVWLTWENPDGSEIEATFRDGVLIHKQQSGLR